MHHLKEIDIDSSLFSWAFPTLPSTRHRSACNCRLQYMSCNVCLSVWSLVRPLLQTHLKWNHLQTRQSSLQPELTLISYLAPPCTTGRRRWPSPRKWPPPPSTTGRASCNGWTGRHRRSSRLKDGWMDGWMDGWIGCEIEATTDRPGSDATLE